MRRAQKGDSRIAPSTFDPAQIGAIRLRLSLYWFTGAIGSSLWPYYARMHGSWPTPKGQTVDVPVGYAEFPREILRPPRSLAAMTYSDIRRWSVMAKGGHFAALEHRTRGPAR